MTAVDILATALLATGGYVAVWTLAIETIPNAKRIGRALVGAGASS